MDAGALAFIVVEIPVSRGRGFNSPVSTAKDGDESFDECGYPLYQASQPVDGRPEKSQRRSRK
jgi:hypothetical protein